MTVPRQKLNTGPGTVGRRRSLFPLRAVLAGCFMLYLLVSLGIPVAFSLPWQVSFFGLFGVLAGVLLVALGICLQIWSFRQLGWRRALGRELFLPASESELVTTGIYAHSRNPLYLAAILLLLGLFFLVRLTPLGFLTVIFAGHFVAVAKWEEAELRSRFGDEYEAYRRRVPLFIPRWKLND